MLVEGAAYHSGAPCNTGIVQSDVGPVDEYVQERCLCIVYSRVGSLPVKGPDVDRRARDERRRHDDSQEDARHDLPVARQSPGYQAGHGQGRHAHCSFSSGAKLCSRRFTPWPSLKATTSSTSSVPGLELVTIPSPKMEWRTLSPVRIDSAPSPESAVRSRCAARRRTGRPSSVSEGDRWDVSRLGETTRSLGTSARKRDGSVGCDQPHKPRRKARTR